MRPNGLAASRVVSVVTPTKGLGQLLERGLKAVFEQTVPGNRSCGADDAIRSFSKMGLDALVIDDWLIERAPA